MGISSNLAASRLIQPGVIASSSERPAAPYEGQVVYQTDTNATYVYNGSAWVMLTNADTPPGLQFIKSVTIGTAVSSVEVTGAFSSDFESYRILISNMKPSASGGLGFRIATLNSAAYYGNLNYMLYSGTSITVEGYNAATQLYIALTNAADSDLFCSLDITNANSAKDKYLHGGYYGRGYSGNFGGIIIDANARTSFTILNSSGTMTGGTIRVYGYRNS